MTITNAQALNMAAALSAAIEPDAVDKMTHDEKNRCVYRMGKTHGKLISELKAFNKQDETLRDAAIKRDKKGNKVKARVKDEETGEWKDSESAFQWGDFETYQTERGKLLDEELEVDAVSFPLEWLEGNPHLGALASACADLIEDE